MLVCVVCVCCVVYMLCLFVLCMTVCSMHLCLWRCSNIFSSTIYFNLVALHNLMRNARQILRMIEKLQRKIPVKYSICKPIENSKCSQYKHAAHVCTRADILHAHSKLMDTCMNTHR